MTYRTLWHCFFHSSINYMNMKRLNVASLWAFSALLAIAQPPLRDSNSVVLKDNTRFILDSNYVSHHTPGRRSHDDSASLSERRITSHEVHQKYKYSTNNTSSRKSARASASSGK